MLILVSLLLGAAGYGLAARKGGGAIQKALGAVLFVVGVISLLTIMFDNNGWFVLFGAGVAVLYAGLLIFQQGAKLLGAVAAVFGLFVLWGTLDTIQVLDGTPGEIKDRVGPVISRMVTEADQTAEDIEADTG